MADANTTASNTATTPKRATATRKAAPKTAAPRKTTAARKAPAKRSAASKSTVEKMEAKTRSYTRRAVKTAKGYEKEVEKTADKLTERARAVSRNAFLASLGCYGKAYDRIQTRLDKLQSRLDDRGKAATVAYADLVKRGSKIEKDAKGLLGDLERDTLRDRKKLEAKLAKARARFSELRSSAGFGTTA